MVMMIREMEIREEGREEGRAEGIEEGRAEGIEEGIVGAVQILRDLNVADHCITEKIMQQFHLSKEKAESYVFPAAGVIA